jgi:hypothetical protein
MEQQGFTTQSHPSQGFLGSYGGTRGDSGSSASHDAAEADYENGVTNALQEEVLRIVRGDGRRGTTAAEARSATGQHHGRVSSALTKLHIAGKIVALEERRGHGGIYVAPEYVLGRPTRPYRRQAKRVDEEAVLGVLLNHTLWRNGKCSCGWYPSEGDLSYRRHVAREITEALS